MKKIAIIPNLLKDKNLSMTEKIIDILGEYGCEVVLPAEFSSHENLYAKKNIEFKDEKSVPSKTDFCIALGGDGSILKAAKIASEYSVPILGVNLGKVGYIAELEPFELTKLGLVLNREYHLEERMMLTLEGSEKFALNDIVFSSSKVGRLSEISVGIDGVTVNSFRADGIVVATPTGSTAYSMSAGGPIVDPKIECICLTPVCPYSLKSKPAIVGAQSEVEITNETAGDLEMTVSVDGEEIKRVKKGECVRIYKAQKKAAFIRLGKSSFYSAIHRKLSE